jgi:hypothetical protein
MVYRSQLRIVILQYFMISNSRLSMMKLTTNQGPSKTQINYITVQKSIKVLHQKKLRNPLRP